MAGTPLHDRSAFRLVSGLWKGDREPLKPANVVRSTNFRGDGVLDFSDVVQLPVEGRLFEERALLPGDIVIERSGGGPKQPVGRVAYFNPPDDAAYFTSNFTTALRVVDRSKFDPEFVALYLHALYLSGATETLQRATTGIRNLDWQEYLAFEVPNLDIADQQSLARVITLLRTEYDVEARSAENAIETKQALMADMFSRGLRGEGQYETEIGYLPRSWNLMLFSEVRQWLQYGTSTRCSPVEASYPVLRIPNIGSGKVDASDLKYCDLPEKEAAKYQLELGDLIFIRTNGVLERLGSCAVYRGAPKQALFASYLIRARLDLKRVEPRFVAHFYGSKLGTSLVAGRATPASDGKYNLNTGTIDALPLPVPPTLDEQVEIADILDTMDAKIALHQQKRAVLEELFKALLHKLMTGEIDVNDLDLSALQSAT
jgi:type I restriction enzyme S subunit